MRKIPVLGFAWLVVAACGGSTVATGPSCGPGTTIVNGQCVAPTGGGAGSDALGGAAGGGGAVGTGGTGGGSAGGFAGSAVGGSSMIADGGGGQPPTDFCTGHAVVATGMPGLMDDFEDGDGNLLHNDGRFGGWLLANNGACTLTPATTMVLPEPPVAGATVNNASKYAMHISATGCTGSNGPSLQTTFNLYGIEGCAYDVTQYDGMYFWATGNGLRLEASVGLTTTIPAKYGGTGSCAQDATDKGCWDAFSTYVNVTPDWKEYSFTWSQLHQSGWGTKTPWDTTLAASIHFAISASQASVATADLSIDDVGFFKGTPPTDPPMPSQ